MNIINPDFHLLPAYRMSPFMTSSITFNKELLESNYAIEYFDKKFGENNWALTENGRHAIAIALEHFSLKENDVVTIVTTSQNYYISSCVTKTIEKFCQWNREIVPETKVILVNHEFGFPFSEMDKLSKLNIPIIEDCCTTFFSQDTQQRIGKYGEFSVYSFPKFFPIQVGGIVISNTKKLQKVSFVNNEAQSYLTKVISYYLKNENQLISKRAENYQYALSKFSLIGFEARFEINNYIIPYALVLKNNSIVKDLHSLKEFLNKNGIQNSVFYGEDAFFIANHQNLSKIDIDLIFECVQTFIKNQ